MRPFLRLRLSGPDFKPVIGFRFVLINYEIIDNSAQKKQAGELASDHAIHTSGYSEMLIELPEHCKNGMIAPV